MILQIGANQISGSGSDSSGEFTVRGEYDLEDVQLIKGYPFWKVRYFGRWDGQMISGRWTILDGDFFDAGVFELWPEEEGSAMEFFVEEATSVG